MNGLQAGRRSHGVAAATAFFSLWLSVASARATDAGATVEAIWMPQVVSFAYKADGTFYTCIDLWQKIEAFLQKLGARAGATVRGFHCDDLGSFATLEIAFESPVEATPENIRAVTEHDTRDLLVARLRGESLPTAADVKRFPAMWKTISLRDARNQFTAADCELVRQLRRQIVPKLSVQIVKEPSRCAPALSRAGPPSIRLRALVIAG